MSITQARRLRRSATLPERLLKSRFKSASVRFRHQHPIGDYIVDFYCAAAKLVIEMDGIAHDMGDNPQRDIMRDKWIEAQGYTVVRIAASDVLRDPDEVGASILTMCQNPPPRR